jgi:hypothetical protein
MKKKTSLVSAILSLFFCLNSFFISGAEATPDSGVEATHHLWAPEFPGQIEDGVPDVEANRAIYVPNREVKGHMVFNLTGAVGGNGDVIGPLNIMLELKKKYSESQFTAVVDDYALSVLSNTRGKDSLKELSEELGVSLVRVSVDPERQKEEMKEIKPADYFFDLFYQSKASRWPNEFPFLTGKTKVIGTESYHHELTNGRDYILEYGTARGLFFSPPGTSKARSGIIEDPEEGPFIGKTLDERRKLAASYFDPGVVKDILLKEKFPDAKLGLLYGVHTFFLTANPQDYFDQVQSYMKSIKDYASKDHPLIIFSTNSAKILEQVINTPKTMLKIYNIDELSQLDKLENKLYVVALGGQTAKRFAGLIASSDVPVLVEGNNSLSMPIRLEIPFHMLKSGWNDPNRRDTAQLVHDSESAVHGGRCKNPLYRDIYDLINSYRFPDFSKLLEKVRDEEEEKNTLKQINQDTPTFSLKIMYMMELFHKLQSLKELSNKSTAKINAIKLMESLDHIEDLSLQISALELAHEMKLLTGRDYSRRKKAIAKAGKTELEKAKDDLLSRLERQRWQLSDERYKRIKENILKTDGYERLINGYHWLKVPNSSLVSAKEKHDWLRDRIHEEMPSSFRNVFDKWALSYGDRKNLVELQGMLEMLKRRDPKVLDNKIYKEIYNEFIRDFKESMKEDSEYLWNDDIFNQATGPANMKVVMRQMVEIYLEGLKQ